MKVFIMSGILFTLVAVNAQASTIILKDGRTITGDIIQQDKTKVIVKEGEVSLTYYTDEIASIDKKSSAVKAIDTAPETEKEKLVEQFMSYSPTDEIIDHWVKNNFKPEYQQEILTAEKENILTLTEVRKKILMQGFSLADLKAVLNFYSSAEGKQFSKDNIENRNRMAVEFFSLTGQVAREAKNHRRAIIK